jgi:transmembrane sensor
MESKEKYQSINQSINQSVRYYRVPASIEKGAALNLLLNKISQQPEKRSGIIRMNSWVVRAAGFAAAAAILVALLVFTGRETIQNDSMQAQSFRLPDQSRVILAPGSSLRFSRSFANRSVTLSGESYFEVTQGTGFEVVTGAGKISVLGTRFTVRATQSDLEVSCFSGSVNVEGKQDEQLLGSGQGVVMTPSGVRQTDLGGAKFPEIALFRASYQQVSMTKILQDIESFFGVTIQMPVLADRQYTGTFETGSLENALILICEPLGLDFTQSENNLIIIKEDEL